MKVAANDYQEETMKMVGVSILSLFFSAIACSQNTWDDDEITRIFDGIDVTAALQRVEEKGVTPYDFGLKLLNMGYPDKAKEWYVAVGIHTKDLQYVYGLAWVKWLTGDSQGALNDSKYILARKPTPLIKARTLYMLGAINVDEYKFGAAQEYLQAGFEAYGELNKPGGQYLCLSMMAMGAVFERNLDKVEQLLEQSLEYNEKNGQRGYKPDDMGRTYEIISELRFAQGNYDSSLLAAQQSVEAYRTALKHSFADEVEAKVALLYFLNGEPKAARKLATQLWEKHHTARDRGRLLAYNSITLMKISLCAQRNEDAAEKELAARAWANSGPGGKALIKLLEWIKDTPCPEWR